MKLRRLNNSKTRVWWFAVILLLRSYVSGDSIKIARYHIAGTYGRINFGKRRPRVIARNIFDFSYLPLEDENSMVEWKNAFFYKILQYRHARGQLGSKSGKRASFGLNCHFVLLHLVNLTSWTKMVSTDPVYQASNEQWIIPLEENISTDCFCLNMIILRYFVGQVVCNIIK